MAEQKIVDRIRKVLAKAEGTNNEAEAEMLMAKVHAMLEEHNLAMLDIATLDADDPVHTLRDGFVVNKAVAWQKHVVVALARYYGCRPVLSTKWVTSPRNGKLAERDVVHVTGRLSNTTTWELMIPFVRQQVRDLGNALYKREPDRYHSPKAAICAVGNALVWRINKLAAEAETKDEQRVASGERALVPVDMIDAMVEQEFPNLVAARRSNLKSNAGARAAAGNVSLHRQTGGSSTKLLA